MCVGGLFGGGRRMPAPPPRQSPPPSMKAPAPPSETVTPEKIKDESGEDKIDTKKKKALEIKKVKEGVKTFGAIDPASLPSTPSGGINQP
mgnify:CR=1 FL=1